jgi:hypothetical protein
MNIYNPTNILVIDDDNTEKYGFEQNELVFILKQIDHVAVVEKNDGSQSLVDVNDFSELWEVVHPILENNDAIHVYSDMYKRTFAIIVQETPFGNFVSEGLALCNPSDDYDIELGMNLSLIRAMKGFFEMQEEFVVNNLT